jgi:ribosomal protein S18 acetylase RimI-like enzyme
MKPVDRPMAMSASFYQKLSDSALAVADLVQQHPKLYEITRINVPFKFRGKGHGTLLLKQITDAADVMQIMLRLYPMESDGPTRAQLIAWYERHGFISDGYNAYWVRPPTSEVYSPGWIDPRKSPQ